MSSIQIRAAVESDVKDIQLCAQQAYVKYVQRMDREPAPMHADFTNQIASGCVSVATSESGLVGYVVAYPEGSKFMLESVAVLPDCSGRGIGKLLIEHVEKTAKQAGYKTVELYTNEAMTENITMYPKLGYVEVGRKRDSGFNRVFFSKPL
ncbi:GNAT family N-acetyltransferase [Vibrio salinus]|uniref:GNAT family N-acetyltransferase n=1 Tax=Vibrio salinus TaxID=2899784 RepID=UPI001E432902|nr:GNAT family N-acetyltransferase [Vibrio salinus]MCE0495433.1 GNAT family N-acetyltransferase [Vibrio salinus]